MLMSMQPAAALLPKDDISDAAGARAAGMAGAFAAVADDYSAYYYNPAGLVLIDRINISGGFDSAFKGSKTDIMLNYAQPVMDSYTAGAAYFKSLYSGSKYTDDILYLSCASYLDDNRTYAIGANIKYMATSLSGYDYYGRAGSLDIGVMVFPDILEKKLKFGFLAQDMDAVMRWSNGSSQRIPLLFKMGASYSYDSTTVADMDVDIIQSDSGQNHSRTGVHLGAEKWFLNRITGNFGLRAGFYWREAVQQNGKFSFGASYGREDFVVDYVYIPDVNRFGDTHKLSISYFTGSREKYGAKPRMEKTPVLEAKKPAENKADAAVAAERYKFMELAISQKYISNAKGSKQGSVEITLKGKPAVSENPDWDLAINDREGKTVMEMKGQGQLPPSFSWNGEDNAGAAAADGDYTVQLTLSVAGSPVWRKAKVVTVDSTPPAFDVVLYPKVFAPVKTSRIKDLTVDIKTKFQDIRSWQMIIKDEKGSAVRKMSGDGYTGRLSWGGRDALDNTIKDGAYEADISMTDFAGNTYALSEPFTVDTYVSRFTPGVDMRIFRPGKDKVTFTPDLAEPDRIKSWDLDIYGPDNRPVRSYKNRPAGVKKVVWETTDEKDAFVRPGTPYRFRMTVYQKNEITNYKEGIIESALPEFKDAGIELTLSAIDFAAGDKTVPADQFGYLNQASEAIKKYARDYFVYIKGTANDNDSAEDNLKLSIDRAQAVKDYLVTAQGVPESNIFIIGYGDGEYADQAEKDEIAKAGKRVEVELLTK